MVEKDACRLRYCLWFLTGTALYVGYGSGHKALQLLRVSMAFLLIAVVIGETHLMVYTEIRDASGAVGTLLKYLIADKHVISMLMILYWQFSGKLRRLQTMVEEKFVSSLLPSSSVHSLDVYLTLFFCANGVVRPLMTAAVKSWERANEANGLVPCMFHLEYGYAIYLFVSTFNTVASNAILCLQVLVTLCLRRLLLKFGEHLEEVCRLEDDQPGSKRRLSSALRTEMGTHIKLLDAVDAIDEVFRWHTFICLALSVPRMIYAVRNFEELFDGQSPATARYITIYTSSFVNILVELIAITTIPATISSAVASAFHRKLRQPGGLTAGGVVIITHSLLFTIASLIVTYLTIIKGSQSGNDASPMQTNSTSA
ncbi:hypothetical protein AAVH_25019 [Aphelenchoides avenae]|nr:hypothetical protein AAVH_25019 [Aphelenchus avenae]